MNEPERAEGAKPKAGDKMGAEPGDGGDGGKPWGKEYLGQQGCVDIGGKE